MGKMDGRRALVVFCLIGASLATAGVTASAQGERCFGEEATINALPGVPTEGTDGDDVIVGTSGDDEIHGGGGADLICGGAGADIIYGNGGHDRLDGGRGPDEMFGGRGRDEMIGGGGNDQLAGGTDDDIIRGSKGRDHASGGGGDDSLSGNGGADELLGGRGHDSLEGGRGKDALWGGRGRDSLAGDGGADALDGGKGNDDLDGGPGPDTCLNGQGAVADTSCLEGLQLSVVAQVGDRTGLITSPPGDDRLFVIEQYHGIRIVDDGELLTTPFLNVEGDVATGNEQGLLGLAFHPDYAENGRLFVSSVARNGNNRIVEYAVRENNPNRVLGSSERLILEIDQPHRWHNGGMLAFGPDGYLYISVGDGGPADDPDGQGQNKDTLLSTILRIDVDGDEPYAIPEDNPFVGRSGADEIWAYGLRNPWRFSFDAESEMLYIADVGQHINDEIDVAPIGEGGLNYGWSTVEGTRCFSPSFGCDRTGLTPPTLNLPHIQEACSAIGGYVYRGEAIPELNGHYFWSDFCNRELNTFLYDDGAVTERTAWLTVPNSSGLKQSIHDAGLGGPGFVTSLGQDAAGELYVSTLGGTVYRIDPIR